MLLRATRTIAGAKFVPSLAVGLAAPLALIAQFATLLGKFTRYLPVPIGVTVTPPELSSIDVPFDATKAHCERPRSGRPPSAFELSADFALDTDSPEPFA